MNSFALKFLIFVGSASLILSRDPKPCKTPDQWEGKYYSYDALRRIRIVGTLSYDANNKRERVFQQIILPKKNQTYDLIYDYKDKSLSVFDFNTGKCSRVSVNKPWTDFGVAKNAVFLGKNFYGSSQLKTDGLLVNTWKDEYPDSNGNTVMHVSTWTANACLPIMDSYVTDEYSLHCVYMNITPG